MPDSKRYRTHQETVEQQNPKGYDYVVAIDAGYSAIKAFTENKHFVFPSYALRMTSGMLQVPKNTDILYKDNETGEIWMLGYEAQEMLSSDNTNDTDGELFSRKRYTNQTFRILCNAARGLALWGKNDDRKVVIQTGLPTAYVKGDTVPLQKALSAPADFSLKVGQLPWKRFNEQVAESDVYVMPQPAGALYSALINNKGEFVPERKKMLSDESVIVLDIGFGTFDFYGIRNRQIVCCESIDELGMRQVLTRTSRKIFDEYGEDIRVQAIQKNLESGKVVCVDDETMSSVEKPIDGLLEKASEEVFEEAFRRAKAVTNAFRGYDKVIVAGGTGEAWFSKIQKFFSGMTSLEVIPSNINDGLPFFYSISRGYYMFRSLQSWKGRPAQ